jgi:hypothetical protein
MIIHKALWLGSLAWGVATNRRFRSRGLKCREILRGGVGFDLREVGESLFDTWRERNIVVVVNDDDLRRWRKGLSIVDIIIGQCFVSHLGPIKIIMW